MVVIDKFTSYFFGTHNVCVSHAQQLPKRFGAIIITRLKFNFYCLQVG